MANERPPHRQHRMLTVKEAAAILRISPWSMYELVKSKSDPDLPIKRFGGSIRFPAEQFLRWAKIEEN